jgi:hypothetical protein
MFAEEIFKQDQFAELTIEEVLSTSEPQLRLR